MILEYKDINQGFMTYLNNSFLIQEVTRNRNLKINSECSSYQAVTGSHQPSVSEHCLSYCIKSSRAAHLHKHLFVEPQRGNPEMELIFYASQLKII